MTDADRMKLMGLAFKLVPARHRLGVMTDALRDEIIAARKQFLEGVVKNSDSFGAIRTFLLTLDGEFSTHIPDAVPSGLPVGGNI